jgi:antitoxin HicB
MEFFAKVRREGADWLVSFADFPNINTYGETLEQALESAEAALNASLESDFERGYILPRPAELARKRNHYPIRVLPHIEIAYALKRMRNGHPQSAIAKKLGISYQAYQKLENPRRCNPTVKTLERIGEALGRTLRITFD